VPAEAAIETRSIEAFEVQPEARLVQPIANAPRLSAASSESMREISVIDELGSRRTIYIPAERPLTVCLDDRELVTLMTLGASPELLVLGFLFNQRLIENAAAIESISVDWNSSTAMVRTHRLPRDMPATLPRTVASGSGQGSVFARLRDHIDAIRLPAAAQARIRGSALRHLLEVMRQHDSIHRHARSVHSCALFQDARLLVSGNGHQGGAERRADFRVAQRRVRHGVRTGKEIRHDAIRTRAESTLPLLCRRGTLRP
jgi:hypothetical protein